MPLRKRVTFPRATTGIRTSQIRKVFSSVLPESDAAQIAGAATRGGRMTADTSFESVEANAADLVSTVFNGDDETALIVQARSGSAVAIEQLVRRYESKLFRLARNFTNNYEDAEEVVQNAFIKAFYNLSAFRGDSRFYTWLVRITVNEALLKIRGSVEWNRRSFVQQVILKMAGRSAAC